MVEVKYKGPGSEAERINARLRNSGDGAGNPATVVKHGTGPSRTITNVHHNAGHHGASPAGGAVRLQSDRGGRDERSGGER